MKPAKRPCVDSPNVVERLPGISVDNGSAAVGEEAAAVVALSPWGGGGTNGGGRWTAERSKSADDDSGRASRSWYAARRCRPLTAADG